MLLSTRIRNFGFDMTRNQHFRSMFLEEMPAELRDMFWSTTPEAVNAHLAAGLEPRNERSYWVWFLGERETFGLTLDGVALRLYVFTNKYSKSHHEAVYETDEELARLAMDALEQAFRVERRRS